MKFSKPAIFLVSLLLASTPTDSWSSQPRSDQKTISNSQPDPKIINPFGIEFSDNYNWTTRETILYGYSSGNGKLVNAALCRSMKSVGCAQNETIRYFAVLPLCSSDATLNCLSSVTIRNKEDGSSQNLEFVRYIGQPQETEYISEDENSLPVGKSASLWRALEKSGEYRYFLVSVVKVGVFQNRNGVLTQDSITYEPSLSGSITPVSFVTGSQFRTNTYVADPNAQSIWPYRASNSSDSAGFRCDVIGDGICLTETDFQTTDNLSLSVRLSQKVNSWFHGRFSSPEIGVEEYAAGVEITVRANPVRVPVISTWVTRPVFTAAERDKVGYNIDQMPGVIQPPTYIDAFNVWSKYLPEKSTYFDIQWSFYNAGANQFAGPPSCIVDQSGLVGIVSSNATLYAANPPKFDEENQTFDYSLAALHLDPDGNVFQGTYDLIISSDAARCIYKFTNSPIRASVSILAGDGGISVATFTMNERNGWIYISVRGLTFSNPTVRVKLFQEVRLETPLPVPAQTQVAKPLIGKKKQTITCIRGKLVKKIVSLNPKCPSGFKKR
jgi:hypothetical protein